MEDKIYNGLVLIVLFCFFAVVICYFSEYSAQPVLYPFNTGIHEVSIDDIVSGKAVRQMKRWVRSEAEVEKGSGRLYCREESSRSGKYYYQYRYMILKGSAGKIIYRDVKSTESCEEGFYKMADEETPKTISFSGMIRKKALAKTPQDYKLGNKANVMTSIIEGDSKPNLISTIIFYVMIACGLAANYVYRKYNSSDAIDFSFEVIDPAREYSEG